MAYTIDDAPLPGKWNEDAPTFINAVRALKAGQSLLTSEHTPNTVVVTCNRVRKDHPDREFTTRKIAHQGTRIWRLK